MDSLKGVPSTLSVGLSAFGRGSSCVKTGGTEKKNWWSVGQKREVKILFHSAPVRGVRSGVKPAALGRKEGGFHKGGGRREVQNALGERAPFGRSAF